MDNNVFDFFSSYDFMVKYLMDNCYDKYEVIVDKSIDNTSVNICIRNSNGDILYNNSIILNNCDKLIDMIRDNFTSNYDVVFGAIDGINNMQFFYMDNFMLYIRLYNKEEYNKAFMYNRGINASIYKKMILTK